MRIVPTLTRVVLGLAALILVSLAPGASPARAAFPGANGPLVFKCVVRGLCTVDAQGRVLTHLPSRDNAYGPEYTADGASIVYSSAHYRQDFDAIHAIDADGSNERIIYRDEQRLISQPSPTPDGATVVFQTDHGIYSVPVAGGEARQLTDLGSDMQPEVSPDGSQVAFLRRGDGVRYSIWVMNIDGSGETRLTADEPGVKARTLDWAPSGGRLLISQGEGRRLAVYMLAADGSGRTRVPGFDDPVDDGFVLSPDGSRIAFTAEDLPCGESHCPLSLNVLPRSGGRARTIAPMGLESANWGVARAPQHARRRCHGRRATIEGTAHDDVIRGTSGRDVIAAGAGDDKVNGRGGDDILCSGPGRDAARGDRGLDRCSGAERSRSCERP